MFWSLESNLFNRAGVPLPHLYRGWDSGTVEGPLGSAFGRTKPSQNPQGFQDGAKKAQAGPAVPLSQPLGTRDSGTATVPSFQTLAPGTWNDWPLGPQSFSAWPQMLSQSWPPRSVVRPSRSWNLFGIWNIASMSPPSGVQATWRLPASRQTNSPGLTSSPATRPSLSTSLPSST